MNAGLEDASDLFESVERLPKSMQALTLRYTAELESGDRDAYEVCREFLTEAKQLGYAFDFGLDGVPCNLREVTGGER